MSNEASFHARITADAKQFVAEMQGAAAALATLVKQAESAGKVSTSGAKNEGAKAAREIQDVYGTARKEADKLHNQTMQDISAENAERKKAISGKKEPGAFFQPQPKRKAALGPVREGSVGALDQLGLEQVLRSTYQLTQAERTRAAMNKVHGQAMLEDRRRSNKIHMDALRMDRERTASIAKVQRKEIDSMVTGRYALYDQANGYDIVARKLMILSTALASTAIVAAKFESAFTSVERAMQPLPDEIDGIRSSLLQMSQEMPIAFADMSKIATLGAQMGITASGIEEFTQNVAAFSAVTGSTIDETAQKFGRIAALANIDPSDFNKLGSAVAYTGINAVATEQEILALSESIAAATTGAGFAADETIAFATTLASLGVAPEQARGVVLRVFADITRAAENGGKRLAAFGKIAGLGAEETAKLWKTDPQEYFNKLLTGLGTVENFTQAMDSLGFTETRETNVLQRLSQNMNIYNKSLVDSKKSYEEGTFLADAYAKTADNLEAKFQTLINTLQSLADSVGSGLIGPLGVFVDAMKEVTVASEKFFKTPFGQLITPLAVGMTAVIATMTAFRAIGLKATAQLFAMRTAMIQMGRAGDLANNTFKNSIQTFLGLQRAVQLRTGEIQFLTRAQYDLAVSNNQVATSTATTGAVVNGWSKQTKAAAIGTRVFTAALSGLSLGLGAVSIISLIGTFAQLNKVSMDLAGSGGGLASFRDAMYEDTKAVENGAKYFGQYQSKITETSNVAKGYVSTLQEVTGGQTTLNSDLTDVNERITEQTLYLGENSRAWLANALANDEAVINMFKQMEESGVGASEMLQKLNIDFQDLEKAALAKPGKGALEYIKTTSPKLKAQIDSLVKGASALSGGTMEGLKQVMEQTANMGNGAASTAAKMWLIAYAIDGITKEGVINSKTMELLGVQFPNLAEQSDVLTESLNNTAKAVRTVVDYANDLNGVFSRITEIKFGRQQQLDEIANGWEKISNKAKDAADAIEEVKQTQLELDAKKELLKYQLAVAERYGDEKRAVQIKAKLAKVEKDLAKESEKLKEAQQEANKSTTDGTQAARDNKDALFGMVGSYQGLIEMYAKTGLKGDALKKKIAELAGEFKTSGLAAGFLESDLKPYVDSFTDFADAADKLPRDVTVEFNLKISAAQQALNEFVAKLDKVDGTTKTTTVVSSYKSVFDLSGLSVQRLLDKISGLQANIEIAKLKLSDPGLSRANRIGFGQGATSAAAEIQRIHDQILRLTGGRNPVYAQGGYVSGPGSSTSDSINARLSNGEFVMRASAVSAYGLDFMNAINQQRSGGVMPKAPAVSSSAGGSQVVYLSPDDRALLRAALDRPIALYTDNQKIAQSANAGNVVLAQRGSN